MGNTLAIAQAVNERTLEGGAFARRPVDEAQVVEVSRLIEGLRNGSRRAALLVQEALSSSDFINTLFVVLDRELMDKYKAITPQWPQYCRRTTVRDFRNKRLVDLLGGNKALSLVPELTEYPERSIFKALYTIAVSKYGGKFALSWEAMVNDELGELADLPGSLANGATNTEDTVGASLLTDGTGPNDSFFNSTAWGRTYNEVAGTWSGGSSNLIAGNPVLTTDSLTAALAAIKARKDPEGLPIQNAAYVLVVPSALEVTAKKILAATEIRITVGSETTIMANWLTGTVRLVVEPWLDVLDTSGNVATTWYLLPDPQQPRPAFFMAFLRGHETPDIRVKSDTGQRAGGGAIDALEGSFDVDDIQYRVRHVVGSAGTDMIGTAVSNGSGS